LYLAYPKPEACRDTVSGPENRLVEALLGMRHVHEAHPDSLGERVLLTAEKVVKGFPGVWENLILYEVDFDIRSSEVQVRE
jgi:hypothetical protein